ncbi:hypothetical protein NA56DRAFT_710401 [Hyaloscypha hepaticicola]|uniref:Uncharacterized protein n=1 Tax=Hyaloscypha hepaticicola TaxID=2082293 RepID=A0A2J6PLN8_9HELO|nr:hypothetical protein NA56DRAFT_710401 [Hyaloscypha hepaticicola]
MPLKNDEVIDGIIDGDDSVVAASMTRWIGCEEERRRRVKRGCGESFIQPQHAWGAQTLGPLSLSFRPPLGQASREDWPSEPTPTPHFASSPFSLAHSGSSGQNPLVMITIPFQRRGLEILHLFERVVRAKSARQRARAAQEQCMGGKKGKTVEKARKETVRWSRRVG